MRIKVLNILIIAGILITGTVVHGEVFCSGTFKGHLQGIAADESGNLYWSFTVTLVKTDAQGKELAKVATPGHSGDLTWHGGKIYIAVANGRWNTEGGGANSFIHVHDDKTLALISKHPLPEVIYGSGGVECYNGRFFVVGGLPKGYQENYVYEYTDTFQFVKRYVIPSGYTSVGIQTVCRGDDGIWWFGYYPAGTFRTDGQFKLLEKHQFDTAIGIARTNEKGIFWVASTKKNDQGTYTGSARRVKQEEILAK